MYVKQYEIDKPREKSSHLFQTIGLGGFEKRELITLPTVFKTVNVEKINTNK